MMGKVRVLIGTEEVSIEAVAALDPRISVAEVTDALLYELWQRRRRIRVRPIETWLRERGGRIPMEAFLGEESPPASAQGDLDTLLREVEVLCCNTNRVPTDVVSRAPRLRWVQVTGAGVDYLAETGLLDSSVVVTNGSGVHSIPLGEFALAFMFMLAVNASRLFGQKEKRLFRPYLRTELFGKTVGVVGLGAIGSGVARLAKAIGMRVVASRRSAVGRERGVFDIDEIYPPQDLLELLAVSDFVVLSVPLTPETTRLIGERELRAMRPGAYLINIARGGVVDEQALIRALKEGWIAGAALEVFEREPLPPESELWGMPNVIISPHMGGQTEMHVERLTQLFCENLRRYLSGEALINVVDKSLGY